MHQRSQQERHPDPDSALHRRGNAEVPGLQGRRLIGNPRNKYLQTEREIHPEVLQR